MMLPQTSTFLRKKPGKSVVSMFDSGIFLVSRVLVTFLRQALGTLARAPQKDVSEGHNTRFRASSGQRLIAEEAQPSDIWIARLD